MFNDAVWGIDLGSTSVRVVRLGKRGANYEINLVDRIDTYRDPMRSTAEDLDAALRKALSIFVVNHKIKKSDRVGVAIPGVGFETFLLDLPPVTKKRIPELVDYEVRTRLGAAGPESIHGYCEIPGPSINETRVLAAAGSGGIVGAYLDALSGVSIVPDRITISPLAVLDALRFDGFEVRDAVVVRIGVGTCDIVLGLRDGPLTKTDPDGTMWIARTLEERFGLGEKEANSERHDLESSRADARFRNVGVEFADRLAQKITNAIEFGRARNTAFSPRRILITGAGVNIPGLADRVSLTLKLPVEIHNKWNRVAIHKQLFGHSLVAEVPSFSSALGAALDAGGSSHATVSLCRTNLAREIQRKTPAIVFSIAALWAGAAGSEWILHHAKVTNTESEKVINEVAERLESSKEIVKLKESARQREDRALLAWRIPAEWNAWEQSLTSVLESLDERATIEAADWNHTEKAVVLILQFTLPMSEDGAPPPNFDTNVRSRFRASGLPEPSLLEESAIFAPASDGTPRRQTGARMKVKFEFDISVNDTKPFGNGGRR
ncbi:MAG: pilus assembly protein PilM [Planctomycetota bacterium]